MYILRSTNCAKDKAGGVVSASSNQCDHGVSDRWMRQQVSDILKRMCYQSNFILYTCS